MADSLGYYREAGLDVSLRHHSFSEDLFGAIAAGREDAIFAGADEMLQGRDHSVPLVAVATWTAMARFMLAYGLVSKPVDANRAFSNDYLA